MMLRGLGMMDLRDDVVARGLAFEEVTIVIDNIHGENQSFLTGAYTKEALQFIESCGNNPFFLYFAHTFPHQPLWASEKFDKKSLPSKYGDAVRGD